MTATDRSARPFDAGLQPERTALAWRRTALAILAASLIALRTLPQMVGTWTIVPAALGATIAAGVVVLAERRYRTQHRRLTTADSDRIALSDGLLAAAVTVLTTLSGIAALTIVLAVRC